MRVITYQNAYIGGQTTLCVACTANEAVRDEMPALGPVNYGEHEGQCDACEQTITCQCGEAMGEVCGWRGPKSATVAVEYMPEQFRDSHTAAGNRGAYPYNGAIRFRAEKSCADMLVESEGEWAKILH